MKNGIWVLVLFFSQFLWGNQVPFGLAESYLKAQIQNRNPINQFTLFSLKNSGTLSVYYSEIAELTENTNLIQGSLGDAVKEMNRDLFKNTEDNIYENSCLILFGAKLKWWRSLTDYNRQIANDDSNAAPNVYDFWSGNQNFRDKYSFLTDLSPEDKEELILLMVKDIAISKNPSVCVPNQWIVLPKSSLSYTQPVLDPSY